MIKKDSIMSRFQPELVLMASSTGGPLALESIIPQLSGDFPAPIIIVQHMLPLFIESLANSLDHKSLLKVIVPDNLETVQAGTVYIAPGGKHIRLDSKKRINFDVSPPINGIRPAADILFESVARSFTWRGVLVVILTGMGRDGTSGLAALKEKLDCFCIAQSEETCVVYGMPRAAVESGHADKISDLGNISEEIERLFLQKG